MRFTNDDGEPFADDQLWAMTTSNDLDERADVLYELAMRSVHANQYGTAADLLTAAVDALEQLGDERRRGNYLCTLALVQLDAGKPADALDSATVSSDVLREHSTGCELATAQRAIGVALFELERYDEAQPQTEAALRLYESCDDREYVALSFSLLADIAERVGDLALAVSRRREELAVRRGIGDPYAAGRAVFILAHALLNAGEPDEAVVLLADLPEHWRYLDEQVLLAEATGAYGQALQAAGDSPAANDALAEATSRLKGLGKRGLAVRYDLERVAVLRDLGHDAEADDLERQVRAYQRVLGVEEPQTDPAPEPEPTPESEEQP